MQRAHMQLQPDNDALCSQYLVIPHNHILNADADKAKQMLPCARAPATSQ